MPSQNQICIYHIYIYVHTHILIDSPRILFKTNWFQVPFLNAVPTDWMLWPSQQPRTCRWPFFCFPRILAVGTGGWKLYTPWPTLPTLTEKLDQDGPKWLKSLHLWPLSFHFHALLWWKGIHQLETLSMNSCRLRGTDLDKKLVSHPSNYIDRLWSGAQPPNQLFSFAPTTFLTKTSDLRCSASSQHRNPPVTFNFTNTSYPTSETLMPSLCSGWFTGIFIWWLSIGRIELASITLLD